MKVLTTPRKDMCYCPGCSHGIVLERLAAALNALDRPLSNVCIVSDIGCIGTADRYFACHTFHGLHGRAITYAEGIKRHRPELTVVVLVGDGGCGIGTAHLVHAARRNVDLTVVVCNNFNFGMTGGQHSPTTPRDAITPTTPDGAADPPLDLCALAVASGAGHVARFPATDRRAEEYLRAALRHPGFALVDVWELCVAYFAERNDLKPARLRELSERWNMPFGLLRDARRPERTTLKGPGPSGSRGRGDGVDHAKPPAPKLAGPEHAEICVAGSAGQHVRTAVGLIGEIAVAGGLYAAQHDDFPITVRRGHSISNLILSRVPILYTALDAPGLICVASADGLARLGSLADLPDNCLLLAEEGLRIPATRARVATVSLADLARSAGRDSVVLALLACGMLLRGWAEPATLRAAAAAVFGGRHRAANLGAIEAGTAQFGRMSSNAT